MPRAHLHESPWFRHILPHTDFASKLGTAQRAQQLFIGGSACNRWLRPTQLQTKHFCWQLCVRGELERRLNLFSEKAEPCSYCVTHHRFPLILFSLCFLFLHFFPSGVLNPGAARCYTVSVRHLIS